MADVRKPLFTYFVGFQLPFFKPYLEIISDYKLQVELIN